MLSICVATHNRWEMVFDTLDSLRRQSSDVPQQIIVVDDGSTRIPEECRNCLEDQAYDLIIHSRNLGLPTARNSALKRAVHKYFTFCDDDDRWPSDLSIRLLNAISNSAQDVRMAIALEPCKKNTWIRRFGQYPKLSELFLAGVTPPVGAQIYETEMIRSMGGYNEQIQSGVDHDLWITLAAEVDPRVAVTWGSTPIVNADLSRRRITTVENTRRHGIEQSLAIWKPRLEETFGTEFFKHFKDSYYRYLDYRFFVISFRKRDYKMTFRRLRRPYLIVDIIKQLGRKITRHQPYNVFPEYNQSDMTER